MSVDECRSLNTARALGQHDRCGTEDALRPPDSLEYDSSPAMGTRIAVPQRKEPSRGRLAPWQERRAKEMMMADLSGAIGLPGLAEACRLSVSHFGQAFKQTVGCPPHRWLMAQRIELAKKMMIVTKLPLCEIALSAGFADQSHFTRVFSQKISSSPAAWRREQAA